METKETTEKKFISNVLNAGSDTQIDPAVKTLLIYFGGLLVSIVVGNLIGDAIADKLIK